MKTMKEISQGFVESGVRKAKSSVGTTILLALLSGIFISFAAVAANTAASLIQNAALAKVISALIFPAGLVMVVIIGSELFTGDNLMVLSFLEKKITLKELIRCWGLVYLGNFLGSIAVAWLVVYSGQIDLFSGDLAIYSIKIAVTKTALEPQKAFILGILCNMLVCLAVWMSAVGRSVHEKIAALYFPIFLFVLSGFEHCVANMYYIPVGMFASHRYAQQAAELGINIQNLGIKNFILHNLLPVTLGNIVGGSVCIGLVFWILYQKQPKRLILDKEG